MRQFAPGADGGDELRRITGLGEDPSGAGLDAAQPVADGVGMAEELRAGDAGGAARPYPGLERAEQQVKLVLGQLEEAAEYRARRLEGGVRRGRDQDVDRAVAELRDPGVPVVAAQRQPGELQRPARL